MNEQTQGNERQTLEAEHTPAAVAERIGGGRGQNYLRDFVYGAIDGCVTTFAIISSAVGAGLSSGIVIVLGFANLLADGFSMAVGNYLGTKAEQQVVHRARTIEENHVDLVPEGEIEEIRQIFQQKGFEGDLLEQVVEVITRDRKLWIETMLTEEWGLSLADVSPVKAAMVTFVAFVLLGLVPLLPFALFWFLAIDHNLAVFTSVGLTVVAFFGIGALKSRYVVESWLRAGTETLLMGGVAAVLAFGVGALLRNAFGADF